MMVDKSTIRDAIVARVVRDDVRAMQPYAVPDATGMVKLDVMENPYELPVALRDELGRRLASLAINRYPEPRADALRALLREKMAVPDGCDILLGNGSDELISIVLMAAARDGASVLSLVPGFSMFTLSTRFARLVSVAVPLTSDFALDRAATIAALHEHRPVVAFIAYPNNPTGNRFERADVEAVIAAAAETQTLVVVDEAYQAFASDSFMADLPAHDNLLVLRTVSKSGLAGARLGYLCGAPAWIEQFDKVRPPFNVNVFTQCAVAFALEHADVLEAQAATLRAERTTLIDTLRAMPGVTPFPSDANFVLFRVEGGDDDRATRVFDRLRDAGVLVKDLSHSHPLCAQCLRVTVSTPDENATFVAALAVALGPLHPQVLLKTA